jgi:hypothetical protein
LVVSYRAAEKVKYDFFIISMKYPIDRIPSYPILNFWDFGRIMAIGQCRALSLEIVNLEFFYNHYEISERKSTHALYWKYGTLAGLESRPLAQLTMDSELITILALRPFK